MKLRTTIASTVGALALAAAAAYAPAASADRVGFNVTFGGSGLCGQRGQRRLRLLRPLAPGAGRRRPVSSAVLPAVYRRTVVVRALPRRIGRIRSIGPITVIATTAIATTVIATTGVTGDRPARIRPLRALIRPGRQRTPRDVRVRGVFVCALPISGHAAARRPAGSTPVLSCSLSPAHACDERPRHRQCRTSFGRECRDPLGRRARRLAADPHARRLPDRQPRLESRADRLGARLPRPARHRVDLHVERRADQGEPVRDAPGAATATRRPAASCSPGTPTSCRSTASRGTPTRSKRRCARRPAVRPRRHRHEELLGDRPLVRARVPAARTRPTRALRAVVRRGGRLHRRAPADRRHRGEGHQADGLHRRRADRHAARGRAQGQAELALSRARLRGAQLADAARRQRRADRVRDRLVHRASARASSATADTATKRTTSRTRPRTSASSTAARRSTSCRAIAGSTSRSAICRSTIRRRSPRTSSASRATFLPDMHAVEPRHVHRVRPAFDAAGIRHARRQRDHVARACLQRQRRRRQGVVRHRSLAVPRRRHPDGDLRTRPHRAGAPAERVGVRSSSSRAARRSCAGSRIACASADASASDTSREHDRVRASSTLSPARSRRSRSRSRTSTRYAARQHRHSVRLALRVRARPGRRSWCRRSRTATRSAARSRSTGCSRKACDRCAARSRPCSPTSRRIGAFDRTDPFASRCVDEDFNRLWTADVLDGPRQIGRPRRARASCVRSTTPPTSCSTCIR